ncbi:MAG TPA: aspartate kinase [Pelagibacteraceae bacterium]|nr:aspartate kinase [Pelagibacteraceae bacterium]
MPLLVLKFGGTSVGSCEKITKVAKLIKKYYDKKNKIIVVSSAMTGVTNDLVRKSKNISDRFEKSEYDVLVSAGEQIACSLLAGSLIQLGLKSRSWLGWQLPILTDGKHASSRIKKINTKDVQYFINKGGIPVITGFQGISIEKRITTLGRGGSDSSAIAVAKFFNADSCIIYTDVDGVYTTDPKVNSKAKKIDKISYEEMLEMASLGATVMQPSSVQDAMLNNIKIDIKSTFSKNLGTKITDEMNVINKKAITGISYTKNEAKITVVGVRDQPGVASEIFKPLKDINLDMIVQTSSSDGGETDITFTIKKEDIKRVINLLKKNKKISYKKIIHDDKVSKVSVVGAGMTTQPGVAQKFFKALAKEKINIMVISTSEIKISVIINQKHINRAVKILHKEFDLE